MSPVRCPFILVAALACACGPAQTHPASTRTNVVASRGPVHVAPPPPTRTRAALRRCSYSVRRVSASGRGGMRPQIAANGDTFAVAWEETADHRGVRVQTFTADAQPLGTAIEIADLARPGASPRVAASPDGDGFAVFWSTEQGDSSTLAMRRIDRAGKPRSDVVSVLSLPGIRPLDATPSDKGYAVAWWNWSGTPHQLAVSFVDKDGRALGRPLAITRAPSPDPTVDIALGGPLGKSAQTVIAWDETIDDAEHVFVGDVGKERLEGRVDLGIGETPRMGTGILVWERARETAIMMAPLAGGSAPVRIADGHVPAAAPHGKNTALCYLHDIDPSDERRVDELFCGTLVDGRLVDGTRIATAPRGIYALSVVSMAEHGGDRIGAVWQTQDPDDTAVSFASLSCPGGGAGAQARR